MASRELVTGASSWMQPIQGAWLSWAMLRAQHSETEMVQAPKSVVGRLAPLISGCHYDRATDVDRWLQPLHVVLEIAGEWSLGKDSLLSSYGLL